MGPTSTPFSKRPGPQNGPVEGPPGFSPLHVSEAQPIAHHLHDQRGDRFPGSPPVDLAYRSNGAFLSPVASLETLYLAQNRPGPARETCIIIALHALAPATHPGGSYERITEEHLRELAVADVRELARWWSHPDMRVWRVGTPWPPEPAVDDVNLAVALSARTKRQISRCIRTALDDLPRSVLEERPILSFTPEDGTYHGVNYCPSFDAPVDHYLRVRVGPESDPRDVDGFLDTVRIMPSGKVALV